MTAKDKAMNLHIKYFMAGAIDFEEAKQYALIAVDELIEEQTMWQNGEVNPYLFWQEVKQEIEKL